MCLTIFFYQFDKNQQIIIFEDKHLFSDDKGFISFYGVYIFKYNNGTQRNAKKII